MSVSRTKTFVALCALLALAAAPAAAQSGPGKLVLSFENLAPLNESTEGIYEGWAILDGMPVSTGVFNVNASGQPVMPGGGAVIAEFDAGQDLTGTTAIKITIEPPADPDPAPSGLVIVEGDVTSAAIPLKAAVPGLATLESMTTGAYLLATPSDNATNDMNNEMGIWFLTMPGPSPGFMNLPDLGPKWEYEGWVVDVSGGSPVPYSTGKFSMASGADSDAAGPMGGGPPFPGQDFVAFQGGPELTLNDGDYATVITIEPVPDNGAAPFQLKPLAGMIPTNALGMNNDLGNQTADTFPTGMARLDAAVPTESAAWGRLKSLYH